MTSPPVPAAGSRDDRGGEALLWTLALVTTITAVVSSLGAPLVPVVAADLGVSLPSAQWALTATLLAGAVSTPVLGRLGSGRLRRPVMLAGIGAVMAGTVVSALPLGFGSLVAGRALQGLGLGLVPLALAVARDVWHGEVLRRRLGLLSVTTVAGAGLGYPLTGLVADLLGLHGAYWFGTALVAVTLVMALRHLPRAADVPPQPVDLPGALLLASGTLAVLLAVSQGDAWGWTSARTLLLGAGGAAAVALWVPLTLRRPRPLVDLRLAMRPGVAGPNLVALVLGVGMYGLLTLAVLIVQTDPADGAGFGLGLGVLVAGLVLVPYSVMSVVGNQLALRVATRLGPSWLLPVGCLAFSASLLTVGLLHQHLWTVLLGMALGGFGSGFSFSSLAALIVPHVPMTETGSAMAFNQLLRYLGFSVGSALSVALLAAFGGDDRALLGVLLLFAVLCLGSGVAVGSAGVRVSRRPGRAAPRAAG